MTEHLRRVRWIAMHPVEVDHSNAGGDKTRLHRRTRNIDVGAIRAKRGRRHRRCCSWHSVEAWRRLSEAHWLEGPRQIVVEASVCSAALLSMRMTRVGLSRTGPSGMRERDSTPTTDGATSPDTSTYASLVTSRQLASADWFTECLCPNRSSDTDSVAVCGLRLARAASHSGRGQEPLV